MRSRFLVRWMLLLLVEVSFVACAEGDASSEAGAAAVRAWVGVELTVSNETSDPGPCDFYAFLENEATPFSDDRVGWWVEGDLAVGELALVVFEDQTRLVVSSAGLPDTEPLVVAMGRRYAVTEAMGTMQVADAGAAASPSEVEVLNGTATRVLQVDLQKADRTFLRESATPTDLVVFDWRPRIWVGCTMADPVEGEVLAPSIVAATHTQISLLGISTADLAITGSDLMGYSFALENVTF